MKYIFVLFACITFSAHAQNFADSNITVQLSQRSAYWISTHVLNNFTFDVRKMPEILAPYVGSGTKPDSLFTVTLEAKYVTGLIELLFSSATAVAIDDYNSIIYNTPTVPGYTALATQVVTKAASGNQRATAQYIVDYFNRRKADFNAVRAEYINKIVNWAKE
jgi:hypothetical protein